MKLELWYPIKPFYVNQPFGVNGAYYQANGINIQEHNGIDMMATHGEPVYAAHDGVCYVEVDDKQGHGVVLIAQNLMDYVSPNCPEGVANFKTIYWHLIDNIPVQSGQIIKKGALLGYADNTGFSTGDHLHFGLKPMRRKEGANTAFLDAADVSNWENIEQNNGYLGAIDPTPYFNGFFAEDIQAVIDNLTQQISLYRQIANLISNFLRKVGILK